MNEQFAPQQALSHTQPRKTLILAGFLALLMFLLFFAASAQAEGSKDLVKNGGYRLYIE